MTMKTPISVALVTALLGACATTTPPTAVQQPMTVRPRPPAATAIANGSIYSPATARPLFEDRRARYYGDIITINIVENTQAAKNSENKTSRTQTVSAGVPTVTGLPIQSLSGMSISANDNNAFDGKGQNTSSNNFSGTITCTVIDVLANGNLMVSGEKQIGLKEGEEFVRFSGVVNPATITTANTVQSTQVADARIEYKANGFIDSSTAMGWLNRFFLSFMPF
jgi:flagellar L-ring protein precursor FlgH